MGKRALDRLSGRHHTAWIHAALIASLLLATACSADDGPWSATLYAGPATNKFATHLLFNGGYDADGMIIAIAPDVRLAKLGWGLTLEAEGQFDQFTFGHDYQTFALGIGLRFHDFPWRDRWPSSVALYTGPSYATNPPATGIGFHEAVVGFERTHWLNYLGFEYAMALSKTSKWDASFRIFHRSGVFGVYSQGADEGTAIGLGVRRRF